MGAKFKRYLKKDIEKGRAELPDGMEYLSGFEYFAIAEQRISGVKSWYVEIIGSSLKNLIGAKEKLNKIRRSNREMKAEIQRLEEENNNHDWNWMGLKSENNILKSTIRKLEKVSEINSVNEEDRSLEFENKDSTIRQLQHELELLKSEIEPLRQANKKLMENAEEDRNFQPHRKSPRNFFVEMEERGVPLNGPAIQGGDGGATKG